MVDVLDCMVGVLVCMVDLDGRCVGLYDGMSIILLHQGDAASLHLKEYCRMIKMISLSYKSPTFTSFWCVCCRNR